MHSNEDFSKRFAMLQDWKKSVAYKTICLKEQEKYNQLLRKGYHYLDNIDRIIAEAKHNATTIAYAVKGNMHRGVYCPSPVLDLLVGGLTRGSILKKPTRSSQITHKYYLNAEGALLYVESLVLDGCTEYLIREPNLILGISVDNTGNLCALSEERYIGGKLQNYTYAEIASDIEETECYRMHSEEYVYDEQGLLSCMWTEYIPMSHDLDKQFFCTFERQFGFLHSYTAVNQIWKQIDPNGTTGFTYTPGVKRKA